MNIDKCKVCASKEMKHDYHSSLCMSCLSMHNKNASDVKYHGDEGQNIPTQEKHHLRLENASNRLKILEPFLDMKNLAIVDIGCGSGEILELASEKSRYALGFDINEKLIKHNISRGRKVLNSEFSRTSLEKFTSGNCLVMISHVLEHIEFPVKFLRKIVNQLKKDDYLWIEVPCHEGSSFKSQGYNWDLWYEEHYYLFSLKFKDVILKIFELEEIVYGPRVFCAGSISLKSKVFSLIKSPINAFSFFLNHPNGTFFMDYMLKDYYYLLYRVK